MKNKTTKSELAMRGGMTLFEVLVVIAVVLVVAAFLLPALAPRHRYSPTIRCVNNLKQVGRAFIVWAGDNNDKFPMELSVTNSGTMELTGTGEVWRHFDVMSNELSTPKLLFCPTDTDSKRTMANQFASAGYSPAGPIVRFSGNSNTSYFIGVEATESNPSTPLAGDRNITLSNLALRAGLHSLPTNAPTGWSDKMHVRQGNILFADGSVQGSSSAQLPSYFHSSGVATNRLAIP
jgi:prepilin-type N-terminal cleavage/methylation domain-containing protein/prepilin-type processing-associated H-X9-DG protein